MRNFVIGISDYAKAIRPDFSVLPQNGIELVTLDGEATGTPAMAYLNAIDGHGQEGLFTAIIVMT
jgi:cysteinyl-tRNA synthetase